MFIKTLGNGLTVCADFSADTGDKCPMDYAAGCELVTAGERSA